MLARATPAELARIPRVRAEFRPGRPLAFELQCRGYAARGLGSAGIFSKRSAWALAIMRRRREARIGRDLFRSEDDPPAAKPTRRYEAADSRRLICPCERRALPHQGNSGRGDWFCCRREGTKEKAPPKEGRDQHLGTRGTACLLVA